MTADARAPAPPPEAHTVFGAALDAAVLFADLLAGPGTERGLLGPRELPRLWSRHLLNCAVVAEVVPSGVAVTDVGSGAGLPGIVLALTRPDLQVTLVEPLLRRSDFLVEAVSELSLGNVVVVRARAEQLRATDAGGRADVVTARAVAPLDRLARWCVPLVRPGGELLALKGSSAYDELAVARPVLRRLGVDEAHVEVLGTGVVDPPTTVVRVRRSAALRPNVGHAGARLAGGRREGIGGRQ